MHRQTKVSIITPSLNQGKFIEETIMSVLNQDYLNIEYIVIDGKSTDNTLEILKKYSDKIIWMSEPDKGQTNAINKGLKMATGEILAWQNSDDTYMTDTVSKVVSFFQKNPDVGMVYGCFNYIDKNSKVLFTKKVIDFDYKKFVRGKFTPNQPAVFFRKKAIETVGHLNENFNYSMDREFYCRIGQKFKIVLIPEVLGNFRIYSQSKSMDYKHKMQREKEFSLVRKIYAPGFVNKIWEIYYYFRTRVAYYIKYRKKMTTD